MTDATTQIAATTSHAEFYKLWSASAASNLADGIGLTAAPCWLGGLFMGIVAFAMLPIVNNKNIATAKQEAERIQS